MKDYVQMVVHELRNPTYKLDFVLDQILEELQIDPKGPSVPESFFQVRSDNFRLRAKLVRRREG